MLELGGGLGGIVGQYPSIVKILWLFFLRVVWLPCRFYVQVKYWKRQILVVSFILTWFQIIIYFYFISHKVSVSKSQSKS